MNNGNATSSHNCEFQKPARDDRTDARLTCAREYVSVAKTGRNARFVDRLSRKRSAGWGASQRQGARALNGAARAFSSGLAVTG
eukprot:420768-Pleurochrysis_carterae.AAC.2